MRETGHQYATNAPATLIKTSATTMFVALKYKIERPEPAFCRLLQRESG